MVEPQALRNELVDFCKAEGFASVGVTSPGAIPEAAERLARFISEDHHGEMGGMAERMAWRGDPTALWPEARSVILLADLRWPPGSVGAAQRPGLSGYQRLCARAGLS